MELLDKKGTYELDKIVMDARTGIIIDAIYENDELKIKRAQDVESEKAIEHRKRREVWDEFETIVHKECGSFYFNFLENGLYNVQIKESIKARFLYLYTYTMYSNKGSYLAHDNNRLMTKKDIEKKLRLSDREFRETLKTLLDTGLLIQQGDYYLANTYLAKRGELTPRQKEMSYTRMFDEGIRSLYENCVARQHKQLYYLFRILPYVNIKFNVICANPSEELAEHIIPLKLNQICEIIGYNIQNANRLKKELYQLKVFDQYAMLGVEGANGMWYKINPRIIYGGTSGHLNELINLISADFSIKM